MFIIGRNTYSTATLAANQWVAHDAVTDQDGFSVTKAVTRLRNAVAGVVVESIAHGEYGLIQCWGLRTGARCSAGSGLTTSKISLGTLLFIRTSGFACHAVLHGAASRTPEQLAHIGFAMAPVNTAAKATSATTWTGKVFVKCI